MLAVNIVKRPLLDLTKPLEYNQGAPIGFIFIEKINVQLMGNNEYILRLYPLIASLVAIFLMYKVITQYVGMNGLVIALGLFSISENLIYFASEAKQYASDTMFVLLLILVAYLCIRRDSTFKQFLILGFIGLISVWMSHPAFFLILAISISFVVGFIKLKDKAKLAWIGSISFVWMINIAILYFVSLHSLSTNNILIDFWQKGFMPLPPWKDWAWFSETFYSVMDKPIGLPFASFSLLIFLIGCISLFLREQPLAILLVLPFPLVLFASSLEKYPFRDRLLLFLVPIVYLFIAEGVEFIRLRIKRFSPKLALGVWGVMAILLLAIPSRNALQNFAKPVMKEHIRPVMSYLTKQWSGGDVIYLYYSAEPAFEYYAPKFGLENARTTLGIVSREKPDRYIQDIDQFLGVQRVWFLFSHNCVWCKVNEEKYFLKQLKLRGKRLRSFRTHGASVYLFDLSNGSEATHINKGDR
jgi:uncharacterized membrane protein